VRPAAKYTLIRHGLAGLALALASGCPSLDGFTGHEVDAGTVDASDAGDSETPDSGLPSKGFLSLGEAAQLCSYVLTCPNLLDSIVESLLLPVDGASYSACVDQLAGPVPPNHPGVVAQSQQLECAAKAGSCAKAAICMGLEEISPGDQRCQATDGGTGVACSPDQTAVYHCDGDYILHCDNGYYGSGSTCLPAATDGGTEYWCSVSQTCTGNTNCKGSVLSYCGVTGQAVSIDCAVKGATCGQDKLQNWLDCVIGNTAPTCSVRESTCNGDRVRVCDGLSFSEVDCAALGGVCDDQPSPHCANNSDICKQTDADLNVCNGDSISLCVGGQPQTFDCMGLNMKCVPGNATYSAHCE
jgi:hypothetical protein